MALNEDEKRQVVVKTQIKTLEKKSKLSNREVRKLDKLYSEDEVLSNHINNKHELANSYAQNESTKIYKSNSSNSTTVNATVNSNNTHKNKKGFFANVKNIFKKHN